MWQAPSRSSQKKKREKTRKFLHIKRVTAELRAASIPGQAPKVATARIILNDISPFGVGLFTEIPFSQGQDIALTFEHPKRFYVRGKIAWCEEVRTSGRIIQTEEFKYRIAIQFSFQSKEDQDAVRVFCEELQREHVTGVVPVAA
jgi:hypothetical protein